jgi:hypothetical protein
MVQHLQQLAIIQLAEIFTVTELQSSPHQMSSALTIKLFHIVIMANRNILNMNCTILRAVNRKLEIFKTHK